MKIPALTLTLSLLCPVLARAEAKVDFNRDVRPILSDKCFRCHGFDEKERKAKLRLDTPDGAVRVLDGHAAVVPGQPEKSELVRRLKPEDPEDIMPPVEMKKPLTDAEKATLTRWIKEGGAYSAHWAFIPPQAPAVPAVEAGAGGNAVDSFLRARLVDEKLAPAAEATREALIRRVTLDLTGLPPTLEEVDAFLSDTTPQAYEKVVDRLLQSPRYGERMALHWLDLARYADTHGYHLDSGRDMWPWRDWVISSFNRNQPWDAFVREQLAGDLLPNPTQDQLVATGFVRNNMINFEGGAIAEEYLTAYIIDRVNTTGTVFMGLTIGCAQCHDHKYDPITQKDYYKLYAYFNAVPESGLDGNKGNAAPVLELKPADHDARKAELAKQVAVLTEAVKKDEAAWQVLEPRDFKSTGGATLTKQADQSLLAGGPVPDKDVYEFTATVPPGGAGSLRVEVMTDPSMKGNGPGRAPNSSFVLSEVEAEAKGAKLKLKDAAADYNQGGFEVAKAIDGKPGTGWAIDGPERHAAGMAWFALEKPLAAGAEVRVRLKFEALGQHEAGRVRVSVGPAAATGSRAELAQAQAKLEAFGKTVPTTMVMRQMDKPRDTFVLMRGEYDKKTDKVEPGVPAALGSLPEGAPANRLALANWLTAPQNPLMARVTVNRFWAMIYGTGLVKTLNDFGSQAEMPSHPQLLDWLATEFIRSGWDVKHLMRLMVTSGAYRQSAAVSPALQEKDPGNRLLARGPRFRLAAEFIRDGALAVSGLLHDQIGGPSVSPYQPAGLWEELSSRGDSKNWSAQIYEQSHGPDLYRRGMYTFWKRTSPPPSLTTFDAPDREICCVSRDRTCTPLQSLILLNDPTYVEAARVLAGRLLSAPGTDAERVVRAFRQCTQRRPTERESGVLAKLLDQQRKRFAADPAAAEKLIATGESPRESGLSAPEHAAWTSVCSALLNLDETVTK